MKYHDLSRRDVMAKAKKLDISYRCTVPRNGDPVYRKVFFSDDYVTERGWTKEDRIRVVYSPGEHALGFKMVTYDSEAGLVRSLTKTKKTRDHYITLTGEFDPLPFITGERVELKELDMREDGFTFARFPGEAKELEIDNGSELVDSVPEKDSSSSEQEASADTDEGENVYDQLNAVEPIRNNDAVESDYDDDAVLDGLDQLGR